MLALQRAPPAPAGTAARQAPRRAAPSPTWRAARPPLRRSPPLAVAVAAFDGEVRTHARATAQPWRKSRTPGARR
jgi:hypothetical protein